LFSMKEAEEELNVWEKQKRLVRIQAEKERIFLEMFFN